MGRIGKKLLAYVIGAYIGSGLVNGWNPQEWSRTEWWAAAFALVLVLAVTEAWRRWWKPNGKGCGGLP